MDTAFGGALRGDFGPISRTNDARAGLVKIDWRLSDRHNVSLKYNHTWSQQENGTFDVDSWGGSANGLEKDYSNAVNGSLVSYLSSNTSNEFRFQYSREDRPRPYVGVRTALLGPDPTNTGLRPFPDVAMDFGSGFRFGMPFFLPIDYYDTRIQLLDNISYAHGNHFFKAGAEWNRVNSVQTFIGFANGRFIFNSVTGFRRYAADSNYVECPDGTNNTTGGRTPCGVAPITGDTIAPVGPVLLYLQQAGVGGLSVIDAGTQSIPQNELALYIQDSWRPTPSWTIDYGLRWEAQVQPDPRTPPASVFFAPFIGQSVINGTGTYAFPSDGTIPSDWKMFQPRFGFAFDPDGSGRQVFRGNAGFYYARIPGLNLASSRSTNGSVGQTLFGSSATVPIGLQAPAFNHLLTPPSGTPIFPDVFVFDKDFKNPRTFTATLGYERQGVNDLPLSLTYTHARTDDLTPEYNWSDRDQRHRFNGWALARLPGDIYVNNRVSYYSAQPASMSCGPSTFSPFAPPRGQRAASPADRNCSDGTVLTRNTLRKDNAFFSWDVRISRPFDVGRRSQLEATIEIFNVTNTDNFRDPAYGGLLFNFDGTIRSGLGDPRQMQAGLRWVF